MSYVLGAVAAAFFLGINFALLLLGGRGFLGVWTLAFTLIILLVVIGRRLRDTERFLSDYPKPPLRFARPRRIDAELTPSRRARLHAVRPRGPKDAA